MNFLLKLPFLNQYIKNFNERLKFKKTVYIVPNRNGFYFAFIIFTLFLMALSYANNVLLFFDFILFGVFLYAQFLSHYNLYSLRVDHIEIKSQFANKPLTGLAKTSNQSYINISDHQLDLNLKHSTETPFMKLLTPKSTQYIEMHFGKVPRGKYQINRIKVFSTYPLGIFYVWKFIKLDATFYVYPEPIGMDLIDYFAGKLESTELDEFKEHHPFENRFKYSRIDWKHYAKSENLLIKVFNSEQDQILDFNLDIVKKNEIELWLSQLTKWLIQADAMNIDWTLQISGSRYYSPQNSLDEILKLLAAYER